MTSSSDTVPPSAARSTRPLRSRRGSALSSGASSSSRRRGAKKGRGPARSWSTKQLLFFAAVEEWAQAGKAYVQKDIAATIGLEPTRVSKWNRIGAFRLAVAELLRAGHAVLIEQAHASLLQSAAKGNILAYTTVMDRLERHGRIKTVEEPTGGAGDPGLALGGTHVHIHAIPERQPMSALPPTLTLPAQPVQSVTTTPAK